MAATSGAFELRQLTIHDKIAAAVKPGVGKTLNTKQVQALVLENTRARILLASFQVILAAQPA